MLNLTNLNSSKIVGTFDKIGISMTEVENGTQKLKSPIKLLEELSNKFKDLDKNDPLRSEILMNIGQKYQANVLSAVLSNWDTYEKMLKDYDSGEGSAAIEANKSANNLEGSLNKLSNTWTNIINNFANSQGLTTAVKGLNSLLQIVNKLTSTLGTSGSLGAVFGAFLGAKNLGRAIA